MAAPAQGAETAATFAAKLATLSYVEAIGWLAAQLAAGLAHAHEHGIVHHDLKPANLLLSDDGRPMLLDFNVAEDTKRPPGTAVAWVAGTLPYMAPEQWAAMQGADVAVDTRSDVYAFGVILFKLLTGRYPFKHFPTTPGNGEAVLEERRAAPPRLRNWNPAVSPALEAIVRRCLEPEPARRYQTPRDLQEDLDCQHAHRPLRHLQEPSRVERAHKWVHRHPRGMVLVLIACFVLVVAGFSIVRERQLEQLQKQENERLNQEARRERALRTWNGFRENLKTAQFLLYTRTNEPDQRAGGIALATRIVDEYGVASNPQWQAAPLVASLPQDKRGTTAEAMAELLLLLARAYLLEHRDNPAAEGVQGHLAKALVLNERAGDASAQAASSPALWRQREILCGLLGRETAARTCRAKADTLPVRTAADHYWLASEHVAAGRLREALPMLQQATRLEPANFWAWFVLANCFERLALDARAEACYATCIALRPSFPWAHFNRGLALLRQQDYRAAAADFDAVLVLRPDVAEAYLNRALARQGMGKLEGAEEDLTEALKRGGATRLYFLRARIREKRGSQEGAEQDYAEGLRRAPEDEKSWVARGYYQLSRDPKAALADFSEALRLNPRSADALQNKAHVLAEKLGRNQEALEVLNTALEQYPDSVKARGGRGVLLARLGQREAALRDAEEVLLRDTNPGRVYQVACIYALTSRQQTADRLQAFQYLSSALRRGYGFDLLEADHDLDPVRGSAEFTRLVDAARALRAPAARAKTN